LAYVPPFCKDEGPEVRVPQHRLRFFSEDTGQDLLEYALLACLLSLTVAGVLPHTGTSLSAVYHRVRSTMDAVVVYDCRPVPIDGRVVGSFGNRCP
jgi:Flp pilus assembly pilin Flp